MSGGAAVRPPPAQAAGLLSTRFRNSAAAERDRLIRRRVKVKARVDRVEGELTSATDELRALEHQIAELAAVASDERGSAEGRARNDPHLLRGRRIRETGVLVLRDHGRDGPIHYREWFELVVAAGYSVLGKRPDAVFLTQVARSPVVRSTTKAGVYQLDRAAPLRLNGQLEEPQGALGALLAGPSSPDELQARNGRHHELSLEIRRVQRSLDEARRSLGEMPEAGGLQDEASDTSSGARGGG
jgi:hypothetical protein